MTTVIELTVAAEADAWRAVGFDVGTDGVLVLGGIRVRLTGGSGPLTGWILGAALDPNVTDIDGLSTTHALVEASAATSHPNGITSIDHIVVNTPDLERTCAAIQAATGAPLKRIREIGTLRQGFHRLGPLIVEVVTHPGITGEQAMFWGLAVNADDLDALYERCGDAVISAPKDAVQSGRRIASFRESARLGVPVAAMTPHVRH